MNFNKEILDQINEKKVELQDKQGELQKLLDETQEEINRNKADIDACDHLLARCGYVPTLSMDNVAQSYVENIGGNTIIEE